MPKEPVNVPFATAAAKTFIERNPSYIVNPHNSKLMSKELIRLVEDEGYDPASVSSYEQAMQNCWEQLELKEPEPRKTIHEMSCEELLALPPREYEKLPSEITREVANWEMAKLREKPVLSEDAAFLTETFEDSGVAYSPDNVSTVRRWLDERNLGYTAANLRLAINANEETLYPSEKVLASMSGDEYAEFLRKDYLRKNDGKLPPNEWGPNYRSWLPSTGRRTKSKYFPRG